MTDIHDLRAQLREARTYQPVASSGGFRIPFGLWAGAAVIIGFVVVMFTPKIYSVQRTAALPVFKEARVRADDPAATAMPVTVSTASAPVSGTSAPNTGANYAGKSADDVMRIADAVCEQRALAAPQRGQAAVEAKLHCYLSEGTARFCSPGQARRATADIINYFKGIEYTNAALVVAAKVMEMPGPYAAPFKKEPGESNLQKTPLTPDPRVVASIEGLLRAGYIARGNREDILANVPRDYKARFTPIVGNKAPCPEPPWWAVWK